MNHIYFLILLLCTANCTRMIERVKEIGKEPTLSEYPLYKYEEDHNDDNYYYSNSLWKPSSRYFFKDNRAGSVGDIIKVNVKVSDNAKLENESKRSRKTLENLPIPKVFGLNKLLPDVMTEDNNLLEIKGNNSNLGTGAIDRNEKINTQVAASVIRVLPNGNLVIEGTQEIRVNFEVRQIYLSGIVRSADISVDNTVDSSQISQLRFSYGGKGHISDVQQPRLGSQIVDIISPF